MHGKAAGWSDAYSSFMPRRAPTHLREHYNNTMARVTVLASAFTPEHDARILALAAAGHGWASIAAALGTGHNDNQVLRRHRWLRRHGSAPTAAAAAAAASSAADSDSS